MDFKKIADKAKQVVDSRGGADSLKEDAEQLRDIAKGQGSLTVKAKEAASAIKAPGDEGELTGTAADPTAQAAPVAKPEPSLTPSEPRESPRNPAADDLSEGQGRERRHRGGGGGGGGRGRGRGGRGRRRGIDEQG